MKSVNIGVNTFILKLYVTRAIEKENEMESAGVIATFNLIGMGRDTENSASFSTRFKWPKDLCDFLAAKDKYQTAVEAAGPEFKKLLEIPGICYARNDSHYDDPYTLFIKKGSAFSWDEITPEIMQLLGQRHARLTTEQENADVDVLEVSNAF